jgi:hypothetical protein
MDREAGRAPVGPLFCVIDGPTRGRTCLASAVRAELRRHAAETGVRPRFAPHQLRHARAVELAREGAPLPITQRQLGHSYVSTTRCTCKRSTSRRSSPPSAHTSSDDARQRRPGALSSPRTDSGSAQALRLPQGPPRPRRARSARLPRVQPKPDRLPAARRVQQPRQPARGCLIRTTPKRASEESSSAPSGRSRCSYGERLEQPLMSSAGLLLRRSSGHGGCARS